MVQLAQHKGFYKEQAYKQESLRNVMLVRKFFRYINIPFLFIKTLTLYTWKPKFTIFKDLFLAYSANVFDDFLDT